MSGRDPNDQIEELKKQLAKAKEKIEKLEQQLQSGAENIKELQNEKKRLENEVSELKQKIKEEREAKEKVFKDLLDRMDKMEKKSRDDMEKMEKKSRDNMEKMEKMEKKSRDDMEKMEKYRDDMDKMEKKSRDDMDKMEKKSREQDKKLKHCHEEIAFFSKKCVASEKNLKVYMAKTDSLEKFRNMLIIGQLCAKVMEAVYRDVLPGYFKRDDYKQPHLRVINTKIEELCGNDKREAREKWRTWQTVIGEDLVEFMEEKIEMRNEIAHPFPLNENELMEIASSLPGQDKRHLKKVIELWFTRGFRFHVQVY